MTLVFQVLGDGEFDVEAARLKDDADLLTDLVWLTGCVESLNICVAAGRHHERGENAEESCLAAAIGAKQAEDFSCAYFEVKLIERLPLSIVVREADE